MSESSMQLLKELLGEWAQAERRLEVLRIVLTQLPDFHPFSLFQCLDVQRAGSFTASDLLDFFHRNRSFPNDEDVHRFIKSLDADGDGAVTFADLVTAVLPRTAPDLRHSVLSLPQLCARSLPLDALLAAVRLLETYIESVRVLELRKLALANSPDFNVMDTFRLIDIENEAFMTEEKLARFLESVGITDQQSVEAIMRVLDDDCDGKVSYLEFIDAVLPADLRYRAAVTGAGEYLTPTKPQPATPERRVKTAYCSLSRSERKGTRSASPHRSSALQSARKGKNPVARRLAMAFGAAPSVRRVLFAGGPELAELAEVLIAQLAADSAVEEVRESLSLRLDFTVPAFFSTLDPGAKGFISTLTLPKRLRTYRLLLRKDRLSLLLRALDRDKDRRVTVADFAAVMTPHSNEYRTVLIERDESSRKKLQSSVFSLETIELIRQLFLALAECETKNEKLRQGVCQENLFCLQRAAQVLDCRAKGFLTPGDFRTFLKRHGKCVTQAELDTLIERYDWDRDGRVSYSELVSELTPKVPRVQY